jgi:hypothetical protein
MRPGNFATNLTTYNDVMSGKLSGLEVVKE